MRLTLPAGLLLVSTLLAGCGGSSNSAGGSTPGPAATTTTLSASPNPATAGQSVTLTATVTSSSGTPTGAVTFLNGTTSLGTGTLANSTATLTLTTLPTGTDSLTASYPGTAGFQTSTSTAVSEVINAAPVATATTLTATPNPAAASASVTLTATVTASGATPTGSVTFLDGTATLGTGTLTNGVASFTTSSLAAGATHPLTAAYAGASGFLASTSTAVAEVINAAVPSTTTTLTATPNPATTSQTVTLTATVTSISGTPTGNVALLDGTTTLATLTLSNGAATYSTQALAAGTTHTLTAVYAGTAAFTASTSAPVVEVITSATASFSFATPNQTILGFGGSEAFYGNYLDNHPNESQIMSALFNPTTGLGITFLRLQNNYYNFNGSNASSFDTDNIKLFTAAQAALGAAPTVLLSSWTPPASLKSNNSVDGCTTVTNGNCTGGFGTLAQASSGGYNYAGFGQFWLSSLQAYAAQGLMPNYISIQNEPDFPASYVGCLFNPTEAPASLYGSTQSYASYGKAFDAVYQTLATSSLVSIPKMIGPEAFTVANAQALLTQVPSNEIAAVAHHLYGVSSTNGNPTGNIAPETALAAAYPTQLKFETEYYQIPAFDNAIQIHNALTVANDNVYLYWGLTWPSTLANGISTDQGGLLYIDNPFAAQSTWAYPAGWTYNDSYYAMKGYSFFIRPGYIRYNASVTNPDEDVSVYRSPDTKTTVIVLLNTSTTTTDTVGLNLSGISYTNSAVYRSSFGTPITSASAERWNALGAYPTSGITMPPQSEVTVVLTQ
jgi:O-glycosyl hydrolase